VNWVEKAHPTDEELMRAVAEGDRSSLVILYRRHARAAYSLAAHIVGAATAEEVVQDAFLRVFKHAASFDESRGSFLAWFFTIVRRRVVDELGRARSHRMLVAADSWVEAMEAIPDPGADVEEEIDRRERAVVMLDALRMLPPDQRRVLVLAYFGHELSQSAIAEHLGWPLGTVKKRTRLALTKLRSALSGESARARTAALDGDGHGM
jgi:RNA polymerase sigma-70 factor, ECF subfamily